MPPAVRQRARLFKTEAPSAIASEHFAGCSEHAPRSLEIGEDLFPLAAFGIRLHEGRDIVVDPNPEQMPEGASDQLRLHQPRLYQKVTGAKLCEP